MTLDTNATGRVERAKLEAACAARGVEVEFAHATVTDRETEGTPYATSGATLGETAVYGESRYDSGAMYADPVTENRLEAILHVIGSGSFPPRGSRDNLTPGQRRQLRDAMVLDTHARESREIFVSEDEKGFIRHSKRERLEAICRTRILTVEEFCAFVARRPPNPSVTDI